MKSKSKIMKSFILTIVLSCFIFSAFAQLPAPNFNEEKNGSHYSKTITVDELKAHLSIIASDEFEGRETGTEALNKAAEYITEQLRSYGIEPLEQLNNSYFQQVPYEVQQWEKVVVKANGEEFKIMRDFYAWVGLSQHMPSIDAKEIMFLGYGIDHETYSDYKGVDVKDKVIIIHEGEPLDANGLSIITGTKEGTKWNWKMKLEAAYKHGAKLVLVISPNTMKTINRYGNWLIEPSINLFKGKEEITMANHMFISPSMAKGIFGKKFKKIVAANQTLLETKKPQSIMVSTDFKAEMNKTYKVVNSNNILGFIEGTDEAKKEEVVIVSAHYDHIGKRGEDVFNGADDNGTGTTALLEMAQALMQAKSDGVGPRRSVLFLWVAGEEKGLLGSEFYAEHPVFPLANTVADVNVDMIGRTDKEYAKKGTSDYIHVIGSNRLSTELHTINENANKQTVNIILDYKYNDESDPNRYYYRSDHYNFAKNGIPSIFYFSGVHDDYHKSTDTVDKIEFEKMQKIATLIFHTAWELANREERIKVDVK
jgi:hypothetical protein